MKSLLDTSEACQDSYVCSMSPCKEHEMTLQKSEAVFDQEHGIARVLLMFVE